MKTKVIKIHPEYPSSNKIASCVKIIRQGGLVVFPTETVYGIAADFSNPQAMKRLREVKKRAEGKPFSVLIAQRGLVSNYTTMTDPFLYKLIDEFWPGPLTVVIPANEEGTTIGVRMPDNMIALRLVQDSQCAIAAPSANFENHNPPTTCQEALADLDGLVEAAIDGGKTRIGIGSSVVDITGETPKMLREGVITKKDITKVQNKKVILFICTGNSCRSVMAEFLLKKAVAGRKDVEIHSAGTGVYLRSTASDETIAVLKEEGMDASDHLASPIDTIMLKKADLIFVMTRAHRVQVLERVPAVEQRIYLLKEFVNDPINSHEEIDVPDPIGRSHEEYQECLGVLKQAVTKIVELI